MYTETLIICLLYVNVGTNDNVINNMINHILCISFESAQDYLETKRMIFPRFYFLSNAELLDILSDSRNPECVQVISFIILCSAMLLSNQVRILCY